MIEDFHYLAVEERRYFAFDLKALWDFGLFVVIVGVWSENNMLLYLNPDLSGRVQEISIAWTEEELKKVLGKGGSALKLRFTQKFEIRASHDCFGNVGILQSLVLKTLDHLSIFDEADALREIDSLDALEFATMQYADQLNPLYQQFARRVSSGIRNRKDSTGIYAHAMAAVMNSSDGELTKGLGIDRIFEKASAREKRVQKGNLRIVLEKFESLQVDADGRGLVLSYNSSTSEMTVVDRQLLLYRKYATVNWPWEALIAEANTLPLDFGDSVE